MPLSTTAMVMLVAFLKPAAARAWPRRIAPCPHCRDASGSGPVFFVRFANSLRTGGTNAYSTSFMRATRAASCDALVPLLTLSSTRRGDWALAARPPPAPPANIASARAPPPSPSSKTFLILATCPLSSRRASPDSAVTPAARAARPPVDIADSGVRVGVAATDVTLAMTTCSDFFGGFTSCCHSRYCSGSFAITPHRTKVATLGRYSTRFGNAPSGSCGTALQRL